MVAFGVSRTFRSKPRPDRSPIRSQHELGVAPPGVGGSSARKRSAEGARRGDRRASRHEGSRTHGAIEPGGLSADGRCVGASSDPESASRPTLHRLAQQPSFSPSTDSGGSAAVLESGASGSAFGFRAGNGGVVPRSRYGPRHRQSCGPQAVARRTDDGPQRTRRCLRKDPTRNVSARSTGRAHTNGDWSC